jgi:GDP-mannose transporter
MDDKKNEDYVVQMPDRDFDRDEKDSFLAKPNLARPSRGQNDLSQSFSALDNSPPLSVVAYCLSSISMTVVNKYVVSGTFWNLNFFYLAIQVWKIFLEESFGDSRR